MKISISYPLFESETIESLFKNFSKEQKVAFGEILGTIPSDGYFGINQSGLYNYILCVKDRDFVDYISENFFKLGIKTNIHRRKSGLWYVEVSRKWFYKLLYYLRKQNGDWLFNSKIIQFPDPEFQSAIIRSFADADGSATCTIRDGKFYSRRIAIYNKSKKLLLQLQLILKRFDINSYIRKDREARETNIREQLVKFPLVYSLRITNHRNLKLFYNKINFKIKRKAEKLGKMINSYRHIGKEYKEKDYRQILSLYKKFKNCREVSRLTGVPAQTIQNWIFLGKKPRTLKLVDCF